MASPSAEQGCFSDVRKVGYLRKPKSMHKRFFVLRAASSAGPSRLEYYENEKKWRHKSGAPKRSIPLENCFNINKRADSKNKYLVALYTKDEYFAIAADNELEQDTWYQALVDLHNRGKVHESAGSNKTGIGEDNYGEITPGPAFKEVWQVILKPKGLGQTKNLTGVYRLCLTNKTLGFVKLNSDAAAVVLQLMNIRRCGHSENFFFIEVGRSAVTGPGEFWMQVDDSVVAQNMHETILEAMKAMSEEFRPRSKSQSSSNCSNPISVPVRTRHHHNNPPPSQVGLGRRSRAESVTATSPAGASKHSQSFRVRASSDGEGTMSRPASVDGSPSSPCTARPHSQRHRGGSRLHPPLNHSRSIPMPSSRCSPSAVSPVSLSSSSTSGHGSTSDCLFPRRSSASISGSPSDGGFISSDEYGSSPCDFRSSFRSVTPDSLGHTPPAKEEELNNYICMAKPGSPTSNGSQSRSHSRGTPNRLDEPELEKCFRKRTHSSGTSPPTLSHQKTTLQSSAATLDEYTVMTPAYSHSRSASSSSSSSTYRSSFMPTRLYPEESLEMQPAEGSNGSSHKDDGYMPMSPGVAPSVVMGKTGDYMPMSPKSVSAPQQIVNPRQHSRVDTNGYMMMSPSGSCSPDVSSNYRKIWSNGVNPKLSVESTEEKVSCGDYINMSPASCSTIGTPPDCYFNPVDEPSRPAYAYFSLPRSFKHANRKQDQSPLRVSLGTSRLACTESSSSSASSDSLGGQCSSHPPAVRPKRSEVSSRLARPTRLSLDANKASTLPRMRESPFPPEPKSPGEYVNIEFNDKAFSASLASLFSPVFTGNGNDIQSVQSSTDYMNIQLGSTSSLSSSRIPSSCSDYAVIAPSETSASQPLPCESICERDYISMQLAVSCSGYPNSQMMLMHSSLPDSDAPHCSDSPNDGILTLSAGPGRPGLGPLTGLSAFTRINSIPARDQGAKVIRADPQGRRRHSSETFASTTTKGAVGTTAGIQSEDVKRHSSASFENVWLKPVEAAVTTTTTTFASSSPAASTSSGPRETSTAATLAQQKNNGLNYIDLDLAQNRLQAVPDWSLFQARQAELDATGGAEELSAYASISFQKADETRGNLTHREDTLHQEPSFNRRAFPQQWMGTNST
ncbi:insulin receptor substrate 1 isoform X1 [Astyanax mexicanus]|uniref:Insulin receptor substrate 1 isoform X1 n=1 Tax=Astyanax mexicanus TaxID=7994 RepID=A0A8T2L634_ASTMX|nr:insulin receptor substrate 1 isoform X1 [Astyanax mexicanus]